MSYIEQIAFNLNRRDEVPNQELARVLAEESNVEGIAEIASYLKDKNKSVSSDCLKVLYEIGYLKPELILQYKEEFISFLSSKNNRMVWGAMIAISSLAKVIPDEIFIHREQVLDLIETGSVITNVWGVYTIINLAGNGFYKELKKELFRLQDTCRNIDFPKRAESMVSVIQEEDLQEYCKLLEGRIDELTNAGSKRLLKVIKSIRK